MDIDHIVKIQIICIFGEIHTLTGHGLEYFSLEELKALLSSRFDDFGSQLSVGQELVVLFGT